MTLQTQMAEDAAVFFNTSEFAENGVYNGNPIIIIVNRGESNMNGNIISSEGNSDQAVIMVKKTDISDPKSGIQITDKDEVVWRVQRKIDSDDIMHSLACIRPDRSGYGGR